MRVDCVHLGSGIRKVLYKNEKMMPEFRIALIDDFIHP